MKRFLFILAFLSSFLFAQDSTKNFALGALYQGISATDTSLTLIAGHGSRFPLSGDFNAVIWDYSSYGWNITGAYLNSKAEIVRVTANSANVFTITRAQEGTTARAFNVSGHTYFITMNFTGMSAKWFQDISDSISAHADSITALRNSVTASGAFIVGSFQRSITSASYGRPFSDVNYSTTASVGRFYLPTGTYSITDLQIFGLTGAVGATNRAVVKLYKNGVQSITDSIDAVYNDGGQVARNADSTVTITSSDYIYWLITPTNTAGSGVSMDVGVNLLIRKEE